MNTESIQPDSAPSSPIQTTPADFKDAVSTSTSPFSLKRILVPADFSDCGRKALSYALPLAHQYGSRLILLYVVQEPYPVTEFSGLAVAQMEADLCENATTELSQLIAREIGDQVPTDQRVVVGSPETQIVEVATEENIDLIVISTHGRTGLKHVLLGSVVENVVRHAPCPVLVVREREHEFLANASPVGESTGH